MASELFIRKTSGLTRDVSLFYASMSAIIIINFYLPQLYQMIGPLGFPNSNPMWAALLGFPFGLPTMLAYAMLSLAMPRSGGDYIYISRTLHPALGFAQSLVMSLGYMVFCGLNVAWAVTYGAATGLLAAGYVSGDSWLLGAGFWLLSPIGIAVISSILVVVYFWFSMIGKRRQLKLITGGVIVCFFGIFLSYAILAASNPAAFVGAFKAADLVAVTQAKIPFLAGFAHDSWLQTIYFAAFTAWGYVLINVGVTYMAGEVRRPKLNIPMSYIVAGGVVMYAFYIVDAVFRESLIGLPLVDALTYSFFAGTGDYPFPGMMPVLYSWAEVLSNSALISTLIGLIWALGIIHVVIPCINLNCTRVWFAYGMERILPKKFSEIHPKFGTPVLTIIILLIVVEIVVILYAFAPFAYAWISVLPMQFAVAYFITCIAAIVFPFRRKDLYKGSAADMGGKVPVMAICGALGLPVWIVFFINVAVNTGFYGGIVGLMAPLTIWVASFALYALAWGLNKRRGIDITLAYKELPPT